MNFQHLMFSRGGRRVAVVLLAGLAVHMFTHGLGMMEMQRAGWLGEFESWGGDEITFYHHTRCTRERREQQPPISRLHQGQRVFMQDTSSEVMCGEGLSCVFWHFPKHVL